MDKTAQTTTLDTNKGDQISKSPDSSAPTQTLQNTQFEAYKKLRWSVPNNFFDLRSLAVAAIALLEESEERSTCEFIEHAVRLLTNLEEKCLMLVDEVGAEFTDIERGHHG